MKVINVTRARKEKISKESILAVAMWNHTGFQETGETRYFQQYNDLMEVASKLGAKKKAKSSKDDVCELAMRDAVREVNMELAMFPAE